MNWSSLSDFVAMGGYGLYVWGSFGVTAVVIVGEMLSLRGRRRALVSKSPSHDADAPAPGGYPEGAA